MVSKGSLGVMSNATLLTTHWHISASHGLLVKVVKRRKQCRKQAGFTTFIPTSFLNPSNVFWVVTPNEFQSSAFCLESVGEGTSPQHVMFSSHVKGLCLHIGW